MHDEERQQLCLVGTGDRMLGGCECRGPTVLGRDDRGASILGEYHRSLFKNLTL